MNIFEQMGLPTLQNNDGRAKASLNHSPTCLNHPCKMTQQQPFANGTALQQHQLMEKRRLIIENATMKKSMAKLLHDYKQLFEHALVGSA